MRRILLLLPTHSYSASDFLAAGERAGAEVIVGSEKAQALSHLAPGRTVVIPFADPDEAARRIESLAVDRPLQAVVPTDDRTAAVAARASARLGLPGNPPESVAAARDKALSRARFRSAGLPAPRDEVFDLDGESSAEPAKLSWPVVLKPLSLSMSRGVIRADDAVAYRAARARLGRILADVGAGSRFLVEEYIPGDEVAVEGLLTGGRFTMLAMFDKPDPLEGPFFEETIYVTPSRKPMGQQDAIADTVARGCAALGLMHGPVHAEVRINDKGFWPLEIAPRQIGGLCSRTLRFGLGVSLEELIVRHALGEAVPELARRSLQGQGAGVMMLPIPGRGRLAGVEGVDAARGVPLIEDVVITIPAGQPVVPLPEGDRYLGFLFARGGPPEAIEAALRAAHAALTIRIEA